MKRSMVGARSLVGRRIVAFDPRPFDDGRGGTAYDPLITLDNGRQLVFLAHDTEWGSGVTILLRDLPKER